MHPICAQKEIIIRNDQKEKIQCAILLFLDNSDSENEDYEFQNFFYFLELNEIYHMKDDFRQFLQLFLKIVNHHDRSQMFCSKITKILFLLKEKIKESFNNTEILNIFQSN